MLKQPKISWGCWLALGVGLCVGYGVLRFASEAVSDSWILAETSSDTHLGTAALLVEAGSFAGSTTYFFVRDPANSKPVCIGGPYISDGPIKLQEAVWSADGSVIAVRVKVGATAGKGFSRYDGTFWIDAYDFRKHHAVKDGLRITARSETIKDLLKARGAGRKPLSSPSVVGRSVRWSELRQFDIIAEDYKTLYDSAEGIKD